jgi:hypothetical protein
MKKPASINQWFIFPGTTFTVGANVIRSLYPNGETRLMRPARALKLTIQPWELRDAEGFERVFAALNQQRPDGLYVPAGSVMAANRKRIADLALKSRLPSMYATREFVDARASTLGGGF